MIVTVSSTKPASYNAKCVARHRAGVKTPSTKFARSLLNFIVTCAPQSMNAQPNSSARSPDMMTVADRLRSTTLRYNKLSHKRDALARERAGIRAAIVEAMSVRSGIECRVIVAGLTSTVSNEWLTVAPQAAAAKAELEGR
jgi:hypothetical protein